MIDFLFFLFWDTLYLLWHNSMSMQDIYTQLVLLDSVEPQCSNKPLNVLIWQSMSESLQSKENMLHIFTIPPIVGMCSNYYIWYSYQYIYIQCLPECRGTFWLQLCLVLNLSELPLWIYMSLYASTPRRTGFICSGGRHL